jgi:hypothetical protein
MDYITDEVRDCIVNILIDCHRMIGQALFECPLKCGECVYPSMRSIGMAYCHFVSQTRALIGVLNDHLNIDYY